MMKNKIPVNDGGGLYNNAGLCDTLISDVNNLVKQAFSGQYVQFCNGITVIVTKLVNLKKGIMDDLESKDKIIEELKKINNDLVEQVTGLPIDDEKDGVENGND